MRIRWISSVPHLLALIGPLAVYVLSMAPDLGSIDSGELAAVCTHLQVAHPTGYPLYTLLGRLGSLLLPGETPIVRLNLLSAVLAALSCMWVFLLFRRIISAVRPDSAGVVCNLLALGGAWLWAIHPSLWSQAVGNEVHALQAALVTALLYYASKATSAPERLLTVYLLGLTLANHMTVLYLVPGLLVGGLLTGGANDLRHPRLLLCYVVAIIAPLLIYLYLPLRSLSDPLLDWGDPTNLDRFIRHVAASQYRVWLFASAEGFSQNFLAFLDELVSLKSIPLLAASAVGAFALARHDRPGLARLGLGFFVGTLWASGYEIHDLTPYYLIPRLCLAGLAVAGIGFLLTPWRLTTARSVVVLIPLLIAVVLTFQRWPDQSRRDDRFIRLYSTSLLDTLPENAIVLSRHWDVVVSPLIYLQQVERQRPDVAVIDPELFRRSWYFPQLRRTYPGLLDPIEERIEQFLVQLRLFEARRPYDRRLIEDGYRRVISGLFEAHRTNRPFFHTPEVDQSFYGDWFGVPEALAMRMVSNPAYAPIVDPLDPQPWIDQARHVNEEVRRFAWMFPIDLARARIRFLEQVGRHDEAAVWRNALDLLSRIEPGVRR